jgi:glycosyltransferase involved in cell wall biosynthesis
MRVAILNSEIFPYRIQLFRELNNEPSIHLLVLYSKSYGWHRRWTVPPSLMDYPYRILPGFTLRPPKKDFSERREIHFNPTLFIELLRFRPDVLIGYEYSVPAMTALLYSRLFRRPYILWTDCTPHTERHLTSGQRWSRSVIIPRAQLCIATNRKSRGQLLAAGVPRENVLEAPQIHEARAFASKIAADGRSARLPHPLVLYVGALIERKGVQLLLEAFRRVAQMHPTAHLRFVGEGPLRAQLERRVAEWGLTERIELTGFIDYAQIHLQYAQADLFVLPTLEDAFGVVVVEALSAGVPVICSPFAGAADYLQDGESGFIVDPEDTRRLAERIGMLLSDARLRERMARRGRELSLLFDASSVAEVFLTAVRRADGEFRARHGRR